MEVRCSSCATEYEFDDALVSARGTSVKCTNCGHQFRVHPPATMTQAAQGGALETWVVRDARGKETVFRSLRDLQQAIVRGQLDPKHEMSHAGQPFRALQDIYELQTFFNQARLRPPKPAPRTLLGVGHEVEGRASATPGPPRRRGPEVTQDRVTPVAGVPAVRLPAQAPPEPAAPASDVRVQPESGARPSRPLGAAPPRAASEREASPAPPAAAVPWQHIQGLHDAESEDFRRSPGAGSRWIALVVVLGGLALVAGTVGRNYLMGFVRPTQEVPALDPRVPALLDLARTALARGDFDNARAELAKASLLAESEPTVTAAKASLEIAIAEPVWLERRIGQALELEAAKAPAAKTKASAAETEAAEKRALAKQQLDLTLQDRLAKAKTAVTAAVERAQDLPEVVRARVDLLRLSDQPKDARALVGPLSAQASDPDNAYSLGALDVAEGPAGHASAIERLRVAARPEEALGKARALLVYVLALSGDAAGAGAELDKLQTLAPRHRALPGLQELVSTARARAGAPEADSTPRKAAPAPSRAASSAGTPARDDVQSQLAHAASLHRQGDLSGAEKVYQGVIAKRPNDVTALLGLGDIARQRQASATAAAYYDKVLEQNKNNVQALMARADIYWHSGNRARAAELYRRALGQVGPSDPLGQRALRRIEEFDKAGTPSGDEGRSGEELEAAEAASEPSSAGAEEGEPSAPAREEASGPPKNTPAKPAPVTPTEPAIEEINADEDTSSADEAPPP